MRAQKGHDVGNNAVEELADGNLLLFGKALIDFNVIVKTGRFGHDSSASWGRLLTCSVSITTVTHKVTTRKINRHMKRCNNCHLVERACYYRAEAGRGQ